MQLFLKHNFYYAFFTGQEGNLKHLLTGENNEMAGNHRSPAVICSAESEFRTQIQLLILRLITLHLIWQLTILTLFQDDPVEFVKFQRSLTCKKCTKLCYRWSDNCMVYWWLNSVAMFNQPYVMSITNLSVLYFRGGECYIIILACCLLTYTLFCSFRL